MPIVNDMKQETLFSFKDTVEADSSKADRWPTVVAHWDGKAASRIQFEDKEAHIGGRGELNPMQFVLAAFAACDVDLVAMHATMIGLEVNSSESGSVGSFQRSVLHRVGKQTGIWIRPDLLQGDPRRTRRHPGTDCISC